MRWHFTRPLAGGLLLVLSAIPSACNGPASVADSPGDPAPSLDPLPVQQARAYPETVTGDFVSLADFEDAPDSPRGFEQVRYFAIDPPRRGGERKFAVNISRTGAGALAATLPVGAELVFRVPEFHDFSGYTLISLALYSRSLRGDLYVTLVSDSGAWTSPRTLVHRGWNTVLVDIQRLGDRKDFDVRAVREVRIGLADAAAPVTINVDDIMVIHNRRAIAPAPEGMTLRKVGLNFHLRGPHLAGGVALEQGTDGLWRLGTLQPTLQLIAPGRRPPGEAESIRLMGPQRVGQAEVLEANGIRIRLASTWYFPARSGEWLSLAVRRVRWEYSFYRDGRRVTHVALNNAGGRAIGSVRLLAGGAGVWAADGAAAGAIRRPLRGPVGRWSRLWAPPGEHRAGAMSSFARPGRIEIVLGDADAYAPGDAGRDRFDESQGCFFLRGRNGHCRFRVIPPPGGLHSPVFRVAGPWRGPLSVNSQGLGIRRIARLQDGSVLFELPGPLRRPTAVEVRGTVGPPNP